MGFGALIDTAIGVTVIIVLFSLVATAIQEAVAQLINMRGKMLREGLVQLLCDNAPIKRAGDGTRVAQADFEDFKKAVRIETLVPPRSIGRTWVGRQVNAVLDVLRGDEPMPSAIPPRRYAEAMLDLMQEKDARAALVVRTRTLTERKARQIDGLLAEIETATDSSVIADLRARVEAIGTDVRLTLACVASTVDERLAHYELEFNETMDRVSGWYARKAQMALFFIGLFLACGANIDLLRYSDRLLTDEMLRAKVVAYAEVLDANPPAATRGGGAEPAAETGGETGAEDTEETDLADQEELAARNINDLAQQLGSLGVPVGWCAPVQLADAPGGAASPQPGPGDAPLGTDADGAATSAGWSFCGAGRQVRLPTLPAVVGWFLIGFGTTLGAKFWYDLLRALLDMRTSGRQGDAEAESARKKTAATP